ncbi:MAG: helix-turn-helix domain-containing protein [Kordia sp.]|uniref:helix-turn-helix domain-containing protein n=1 Tax=Kordia sp. TaxID=1965332 RepID=UPI00385FCC1A
MQYKKTFFLLLSILTLLCSLSLNAQTDSLQGKSYEELIKLHESTLFKNPTDSKTYALAAYKIAQKENDSRKTAYAIYHIAYANSYIPLNNEALKGIENSISIAKKFNDNLLLFKNHNLRANIFTNIGKESEAIDEYGVAKQYAILTDNPLNKIVVSLNIAYVKKVHENHSGAIELFKENLNILNTLKTSDPKQETYKKQALFNIADCYLRIKNPKEAKKYNDLAIEMLRNEEASMFYNLLLMNEAIINYQMKEFDKAIEISKKAISYYTSINSEDQLITPYFYLGKSNYQLKNHKDAIQYLEKVNAIIAKYKIVYSDQKEGYEILYKCYQKLGDSIKASKNLETYLVLLKKTDSINSNANYKILENEITVLDSNNQKQQKLAKYLYISLAFLLFILVGFFIWFKHKQKQNKLRFKKLLVTIETLEKPKEKIVAEEIITKEISNPVTDENALQILKALENFEEKKLYLRQDCTLGYVAKKLKTNTSYLSNVINTYKEKSFKSYLSELRINAALIQLKNDDKLRSYTIKAIAEEFGFKRSETFSRAFKAQTDIYPSVYIKNLENQHNK